MVIKYTSLNKQTDMGYIPVLSVIIPVYNTNQSFLDQCIESVLLQPCKDFEIIIIDDGSADEIARHLDKYAEKYDFIIVIHTENRGVSHARNIGIEVAAGIYMAFLDSDDIMCSNAYTEKVKSVLLQESCDLYSFSYIVGSNNMQCGSIYCVDDKVVKTLHSLMMQYDPCKHHSSFLINREMLKSHPKIRYPEHIKRNEDYAFMFMVEHTASSIYQKDIKWFIYRDNLQSITHRSDGYDYIVTDTMPAWEWCRILCEGDSLAQKECDIRLFAAVAEYIQYGCESGISVKQIDAVLQNNLFRSSLINYSSMWKYKKETYESFLKHPYFFGLDIV